MSNPYEELWPAWERFVFARDMAMDMIGLEGVDARSACLRGWYIEVERVLGVRMVTAAEVHSVVQWVPTAAVNRADCLVRGVMYFSTERVCKI